MPHYNAVGRQCRIAKCQLTLARRARQRAAAKSDRHWGVAGRGSGQARDCTEVVESILSTVFSQCNSDENADNFEESYRTKIRHCRARHLRRLRR
jgi:hypothetical protein